jgi:hypothetical protein
MEKKLKAPALLEVGIGPEQLEGPHGMVPVAVGQNDFFDILRPKAEFKQVHKPGVIIAGVHDGEIIAFDYINVGRVIIAQEVIELFKKGVGRIKNFGQSQPARVLALFLLLRLAFG